MYLILQNIFLSQKSDQSCAAEIIFIANNTSISILYQKVIPNINYLIHLIKSD